MKADTMTIAFDAPNGVFFAREVKRNLNMYEVKAELFATAKRMVSLKVFFAALWEYASPTIMLRFKSDAASLGQA